MRTVVWQSLSETQQDSILERPAITEGANITAAVSEVIAKVRKEGDAALLEPVSYTHLRAHETN